ncbi:MAG: ABC transporter [Actinomycetales bacterium]|nr:MAG: ABC transporter [Actinomycetales bacterium]
MNLVGLATLPLRVTISATRTTLALGQLAAPDGPILREGGYGTRIAVLIGEDGLLEQLAKLLADERGIIALGNLVADITAEDRPVGKALQRDGLVDRMASEEGPFVRLLEADGPLDRALAEDGPLYRFLAPGGSLDRLLAPDGPLERLTAPGGPIERMLVPGGPLDRILEQDGTLENVLKPGGLLEKLLEEEGILENLLMPGGTLDQLVSLGATFDAIVPRLEALGNAIPNLNQAVAVLSGAVEPLGTLAQRLPGGRRRGVLASASPSSPTAATSDDLYGSE